jgi:hypothetical protein
MGELERSSKLQVVVVAVVAVPSVVVVVAQVAFQQQNERTESACANVQKSSSFASLIGLSRLCVRPADFVTIALFLFTARSLARIKFILLKRTQQRKSSL